MKAQYTDRNKIFPTLVAFVKNELRGGGDRLRGEGGEDQNPFRESSQTRREQRRRQRTRGRGGAHGASGGCFLKNNIYILKFFLYITWSRRSCAPPSDISSAHDQRVSSAVSPEFPTPNQFEFRPKHAPMRAQVQSWCLNICEMRN